MKSYNFCTCENPRIIKNIYTGELLRVGCGCCKACAINRRNKCSLLCSQESQKHLYTLFVTLTYAPGSLPLLQPIRKDFRLQHGYRLFNLCHRHKMYGSMTSFLPDSYDNDSYRMNLLLNKLNLNGFVPYGCKREAQLYIKRLRKYLSKYTDEKIKYYIVLEYGPIHFRPHYHLLLFFDSSETKHYIQRCVYLAWTYQTKKKKTLSSGRTKTIYRLRSFGRVDMSYSQGQAHNYVAGYVNSFVNLPRLFALTPFIRPFALHSKNFGNPILENQKEEIYEDESYRFIDIVQQDNTNLCITQLQGAFKSRFYPKARGFNNTDLQGLFALYSCFNKCRKYYQTENVTQIANAIWFQLHQNINTIHVEPFKHLLKCQDYRHLGGHFETRQDLLINRIKSDLYLSKHFFYFCCNGDERLQYKRFNQILKFWQYDSEIKLRSFYEQQIEYTQLYPDDLDYIPFMYNNFENYFSEHLNDYQGDIYSFYLYENFENYFTKVFKQLFKLDGTLNVRFVPFLKRHNMYNVIQTDACCKYTNSIKHKKLNDLNKIFL